MNPFLVGAAVVGAVSLLSLAVMTAQVNASTRRMAQALADGPRPDGVPLAGLARLRLEADAAGFVPADEGLVRLGDNQLLVMVHPEGTRAELIQHPDHDPGFAFATDLADGSRVVSVPWVHGLERDRIRIPGASFDELLTAHRGGVGERIAAGAQVVAADTATALARAIESDRREMREWSARPWRHSLTVTLQQLRPGAR